MKKAEDISARIAYTKFMQQELLEKC